MDLPSNKWKIKCFEILYQELGFDASSVTNLIVVGDSMNEVKAGQQLKKRLPQCVLKIVKMQDSPSPRDLIKQLKVIKQSWSKLYSDSRNINIKMERSEAEPQDE